jgi:hypothetical protein
MENEKVLGVIPNASLKTGFIRWTTYTLIATTSRLIAAELNSKLIKEEVRKRGEESKEEGHGKFKQFLARAGASFTFANRYLEMDPEDILKETDKNFSIYPRDIVSIKISDGYEDEDGNKSPNRLTIKTSSKKYSFSFGSSTRAARELLNQIGR